MLSEALDSGDVPAPIRHLDTQALGRIQVTDRLSRELLTPLLGELREEFCAHSWQPVLAGAPAAAAFDTFERMIAADRPGRVFTYYRDTGRGPEALGVGVVSDGVAKGFPVEGLPVVGRAFVRPAHRRRALYPAFLRHRLDYCRSRWGDRLMAVHLGTASARVERSFRDLHAGRVVYLGDEDLGAAGPVRALLGLHPPFEAGLRQPMRAELRQDQVAVLAYLSEGAGDIRAAAVLPALDRLGRTHPGFDALGRFLRHLVTLH